MIKLGLYFALGFLCAVFLAVLIAPALWRRAVMLTRKRIEASVPLTTDEIRASQDGLRARHAVEARRLEMELKAANERSAAAANEFARGRADIKTAGDEREAAKAALAASETALRAARDEVRRRQARIDALAEALEKTEAQLQDQQETGRLPRPVSTQGLADASISRTPDELNARVLQLLAAVGERDERLERRDREIVRLRERLRPILVAPDDEAYDLRLADLAIENVRLEAELADLSEQMERGPLPRLEPRDDAKATRALRKEMADLAAKVVNMTAVLEGPDSPIRQIIDAPEATRNRDGVSLADRIRALQLATQRD